MDNKVNDLRYVVKFENLVKNKTIIFLLSKIFLSFKPIFFILGKVFFLGVLRIQLPQHFFCRQNIDMPQQKPWHFLTAEANSEH